MTQEVAVVETPAQSLVKRVAGDDFRKQVSLALPGDVTSDRFVRVAITAVLANPDIAQCEPDSIFGSLIKCAQDGLLPDGREAALASFKDNKTGTKKATYMPMVGGFRKIAAESGWQIDAKCVYANDKFQYEEGLEPKLVHHPVRPGAERGEIVAAYAIARKRGETPMIRVMSVADVMKRAAIAKSDKFWKPWKPEMYEKTVARNIFGDLPLGDRELARRVLEASALEPAESAALMYGPVAGELTAAPSPDVTPEPSITDSDSEGDGQQAEEAQTAAEDAGKGVASSVPDPGEEPDLDDGSGFAIPDDVAALTAAAEAASFLVVEGPQFPKANGKTLGHIGSLKTADQWYAKALRISTPGPLRDAIIAYARVNLPDVYEEYVAEQGGQGQLG